MSAHARVVELSQAPSERTLRTLGAFGLLARCRQNSGTGKDGGTGKGGGTGILPVRCAPKRVREDARSICKDLAHGGIALITGPSGAGKSTVLRSLTRHLQSAGRVVIRVDTVQCPAGPVLDAIDTPVEQACALLARAGLGDALVLARTPGELSTGQRARLRIALAMHRAGKVSCGATLLIDDGASTLDETTAACVAAMLARWIRASRHRLVCATTRADLHAPLRPDIHMHLPLTYMHSPLGAGALGVSS